MAGPEFDLAWEFLNLKNRFEYNELTPEDIENWEITEESENFGESRLDDVKVKLSNGEEAILRNYGEKTIDKKDVVECTITLTEYYGREYTIKRKKVE